MENKTESSFASKEATEDEEEEFPTLEDLMLKNKKAIQKHKRDKYFRAKNKNN